jgi:hypothetical protein
MAQRETLRDCNFRVTGYVDTESDGRKTLYSADWRVSGYYRPDQNRTYDRDWRPVAQGDQLLMTLLRSP